MRTGEAPVATEVFMFGWCAPRHGSSSSRNSSSDVVRSADDVVGGLVTVRRRHKPVEIIDGVSAHSILLNCANSPGSALDSNTSIEVY